MERNRKIQIYCLWAASLFLGIFGAVCLYFAVAGEYNDAMGYFNIGSLFAPAVYCCLGAGVIFGVTGYVLFRKYSAPDCALPSGIFTGVASYAAAALILFTTTFEITESLSVAGSRINAVEIASWVLGILTAASLICTALFAKKGVVKAWISLLSFAPALYCASQVLLLYFDQSVAVNSPIKVICQLSYLSAMLVFCSETGLSLGKGKILPRYIFTLCAAVTIFGTCSVAAVIVTLTGTPCAAFSGVGCAAKLGLFFYACARLAGAVGIEIGITKKPEKAEKTENN